MQQPTKQFGYFARPGRAGPQDLCQRAPALAPLAGKTVAQFGLGCVGAPSALELVRAGVGNLRVLDHDVVEPGTVLRWPLGLSVAGLKKVEVVREFARQNYPYTSVTAFDRKLGAPRFDPAMPESDGAVLEQMTRGADLIYDATAEPGVQFFLSDHAATVGIPYLCVDGTYGGWGGRVCRIVPGRTEGCWLCYQAALEDGAIPGPPADPAGRIQPAGCADPTFTGAGFDLAQVALAGVRTAVGTLCRGSPGGYPDGDWDVLILAFRDAAGAVIPPASTPHTLRRHANCPRCGGS